MSTQVMSPCAASRWSARETVEMGAGNVDADSNNKAGMESAFAGVCVAGPAAGNGGPTSTELTLGDALKLLPLWSPRTAVDSSGGDRTVSDIAVSNIVVPEAIAGDSRRRMIFKLGMLVARELALDMGELGTEDLMALGRQTVADHIMDGSSYPVFVALARAEGKVDEAAWAAGDERKIAAQVDAFVQSEFKDEIALHKALQGLAAEPPLLGRRGLADALLREQGIDTDAWLGPGVVDPNRIGMMTSTWPFTHKWKAGECYFNVDKLKAEHLRKMVLPGGVTPTEEQIARMLRELPVSLDAEFARRFDAHQRRMSSLLADWVAARLSLHAKEVGFDLTGATVTASRATIRFSSPAVGLRTLLGSPNITMPLCGFVMTIQRADRTHRCFMSNRTGAVHALPPESSVESWLEQYHELAFEDVATRAELSKHPGRWYRRILMEEAASGSYDVIRERLSGLFHAEIEPGREAARGQNVSERIVDGVLNLIPFRAMVVALRKGDIPTAVMMGGLDVLSLLPYVGKGARFVATAARLADVGLQSATPWLATSMRFGGAAARQGWRGLGRLLPLDMQRMAVALQDTSPKLAAMLSGIVTRTRGATIPDGVWRVDPGTAATVSTTVATVTDTAETGDAIRTISTVTARSLEGGELSLLSYGERPGFYAQIDAKGERVGALLVADSGGWLYRIMPLASLERYRIDSLEVMSALTARRAGRNGTLALNGRYYARLGSDYVEVTQDLAVSTVARPIWRVVARPGSQPDLIAHRLIYDADEGVWRQATNPPNVLGGMRSARLEPRPRTRGVATQVLDVRMTPDAADLARFRDALVRDIRGATPAQIQILQGVLDRAAADDRGRAILNAMSAYYELLGQKPEIVLSWPDDAAQARPSLMRPVRANTWHLDLDALRSGTTDAAVQEFAAVYNNMTGLLQNEDPFLVLVAEGEPPLDPELESAWTRWLRSDPERGPNAGTGAGTAAGTAPGTSAGTAASSEAGATPLRVDAATMFSTSRERAVAHLRTQLREIRFCGGLDRVTLQGLLRNVLDRSGMLINLSHRGLDSIPPLPRDLKVLSVAGNPIGDWSHLPDGLTVLDAEGTGMSVLPANLPQSLEHLNLAHNRLGGATLALPPRLTWLRLDNNSLTVVPILPDTLEELFIYGNRLRTLPDHFPENLELLDVSHNALTQLPTNWPPRLDILRASHNLLEHLPALHDELEELDVSWNRLQTLPALPNMLHILKAASNELSELPANLPVNLEIISVPRNRLRHLPENFPQGLMYLDVRSNVIDALPQRIVELETCTILLGNNPIPAEALPVIAEGGRGPHIVIEATQNLAQLVAQWLSPSSAEARGRWNAIAQSLGRRDDAREFVLFLGRLRTTVSYRDPGFRAQVEAWLTELSKPERWELLNDTLKVCQESTQSCGDRILLTWNDAQNLLRNDDVHRGMYDDRIPELLKIARQMFRISELTDIARNKVRELKLLALRPEDVDEIEVYLTYAVQLRDSFELTTIAPEMAYYDASLVTSEELEAAKETVSARERQEFSKFLVLDYQPWQTLVRHKAPQAYAQAEEEAHRLLESTFERRMQEEMDRLHLNPQDSDARKNLGRTVMRQIQYDALAPVTRAHLQAMGIRFEEKGVQESAV